MAKTIGQLNPATTIANGDLFVIEQSSQTFKIAASVVRGGLVDADIDDAAAIAYSKLDLDDSIVAGDLTADAVTTAKIEDDAVTTAKIDDDAVTTAKILDANVTTAKVADAAITAAKLSGAQSGSQPIYGARAWALVNHPSNTITASGNVSSLTDNGLGEVTINFATAMASASYSVVVTPQHASGQGNCLANFSTRAAGSVQIIQTSASFTASGDNVFSVAVFQ
jgi:hypothetical protein